MTEVRRAKAGLTRGEARALNALSKRWMSAAKVAERTRTDPDPRLAKVEEDRAERDLASLERQGLAKRMDGATRSLWRRA